MKNETIDVEVVETNIIVLEQKPIISYDLVEKRGKEVAALIASLNLDTIEANEDNLKLLKNTRTDLSKEFKTLEDQRKMVKELILKPYNDFDEAYKKHIATLFTNTDKDLKTKIDTVDDAILDKKIEGIKSYFDLENDFEFVKFEDLNLKIIKSKSDKMIKEEIDEYLSNVRSNLNTIETLDNKDRILVKYQMSKDLNNAISQTNIEVQREKEIKERQEAQKAAQAQREERLREEQAQREEEAKKASCNEVFYEPKVEIIEEVQKEQIFKASFSVYGTRDQISDLKKYMNEKGIRYE